MANRSSIITFFDSPKKVFALKHLNRHSEDPRVRARLVAYERILQQ